MTPSTFPWPWTKGDNRRLTLVVALWVLALNAWALVAIDFLPITRVSPWEPSANQRAPLYARYDSGWYDGIIRFGYNRPPAPGQPSAHAFFPLYPELARFLHLMTGVDSFQCGLAITYLALFFAMPLFLEEAKLRFGEEKAFGTVPFLLLYPVAFFLAAVYTESLFLLLALLSFRDVRNGQAGRAALWAFLAGLTRAPAAALGPPLALAWVALHREKPRRLATAAALLLAPVAGVCLWIFGIGLAKGEPYLFFRSMGAWRHEAGHPTAGAFAFFEELSRYVSTGYFREHPGALLPYLHFVLFSIVTVYLLVKRRLADASWPAGVLALSVLTGTSAGVPRYTSTIYVGHFALFSMTEGRPLLRRALLAAYTAVLLLNTAFFVNWHFVS